MKHIKKFNETVDPSDLSEIKDLFQEYADKWNLSKIENGFARHTNTKSNGYDLFTTSKDHKGGMPGVDYSVCLLATFLISPLIELEEFGELLSGDPRQNNYILRREKKKKEIKTDMGLFVERVKSVGYTYEMTINTATTMVGSVIYYTFIIK